MTLPTPLRAPRALPTPAAHTGRLWALAAPHRLWFSAALGLLVVSSVWWLWPLGGRLGLWAHPPVVLAPTLLHSALMVYGFMPLLFGGFLFTAGPKWLGVPAPSALDTWPDVALQASGWLVWVSGGHVHAGWAVAGSLLACLGLGRMYARFGVLWHRSTAPDRLHAGLIGVAGAIGTVALAGMALALGLGDIGLARLAVQVGLWGFVAPTYVTVAHRMLPFFTSSALPMVSVWRPNWLLWCLLGAMGLKLGSAWAAWAEWPSLTGGLWFGLQSFLLFVGGLLVLWVALVWGLVQSLRIRLLAMLHIGFCWLGVALLLDGVDHLQRLFGTGSGAALGALHAATMGFLGSLMLAMVTRVSCGHGGRALVADGGVWGLFWVLQTAAVLRVVAAFAPPATVAWWTLAAGLAWALAVVPWALRLLGWYQRPRPDGREG